MSNQEIIQLLMWDESPTLLFSLNNRYSDLLNQRWNDLLGNNAQLAATFAPVTKRLLNDYRNTVLLMPDIKSALLTQDVAQYTEKAAQLLRLYLEREQAALKKTLTPALPGYTLHGRQYATNQKTLVHNPYRIGDIVLLFEPDNTGAYDGIGLRTRMQYLEHIECAIELLHLASPVISLFFKQMVKSIIIRQEKSQVWISAAHAGSIHTIEINNPQIFDSTIDLAEYLLSQAIVNFVDLYELGHNFRIRNIKDNMDQSPDKENVSTHIRWAKTATNKRSNNDSFLLYFGLMQFFYRLKSRSAKPLQRLVEEKIVNNTLKLLEGEPVTSNGRSGSHQAIQCALMHSA